MTSAPVPCWMHCGTSPFVSTYTPLAYTPQSYCSRRHCSGQCPRILLHLLQVNPFLSQFFASVVSVGSTATKGRTQVQVTERMGMWMEDEAQGHCYGGWGMGTRMFIILFCLLCVHSKFSFKKKRYVNQAVFTPNKEQISHICLFYFSKVYTHFYDRQNFKFT